ERDLAIAVREYGLHLFVRDQVRSVPGPELDQLGGRIEAMPGDLRGHGVAVRRKRAAFHQDLCSLSLWPIEAREHQMQIHRERIHRDDFARRGAGDVLESRSELLVIFDPRTCPLLVAEHAELRPRIEFLADAVARRERLQAEGMSAEV